jgi:hypothetical protein
MRLRRCATSWGCDKKQSARKEHDSGKRALPAEEFAVPIDPETSRLGPPPFWDSREVKVSGDDKWAFSDYHVKSIPYDYRSYILYGYTIFPAGVKVGTRFEIDTRSPTLLTGPGIWHIAGIWYAPLEPDALRVLGVSPEETRPFMWTSNVPIETVEEPPYHEGQVLHSRVPPVPYKAPPPTQPRPPLVIVRRRGRLVAEPVRTNSWFMLARRFLGLPAPASDRNDANALSLGIDLADHEIIHWSGAARRVTTSVAGVLILTSGRVIHRPTAVPRVLGAKSFEIRRREVIDVGFEAIENSRSHRTNEMSLRLILVGDRKELFVVKSQTEAFDQFSKHITPIADTWY